MTSSPWATPTKGKNCLRPNRKSVILKSCLWVCVCGISSRPVSIVRLNWKEETNIAGNQIMIKSFKDDCSMTNRTFKVIYGARNWYLTCKDWITWNTELITQKKINDRSFFQLFSEIKVKTGLLFSLKIIVIVILNMITKSNERVFL